MPDVKHVPLYPGARNIVVEYSPTVSPRSKTIYITPDDYLAVLAFYQKELGAQGWRCEVETGDRPCDHFYWTDTKGDTESDFALSISGEELLGDTDITILANRWPNPNKVPLMPGAEQITVDYEKDAEYATSYPESAPIWERVTTYVVRAKSEDVYNFYSHRLAEPDWQWVADSTSTAPKMVYRYLRDTTGGDQYEYRGGAVEITSEATPDGLTRVRVLAKGYGVNP